MDRKHEATKDGIGEGFAGWVYQHPITVAEAIEDGAEKAIRSWLDANTELIADRIATKVASQSATKGNRR